MSGSLLLLPAELQQAIALRLNVRDRMALGSTQRSAMSLIAHAIVLEFRLGKKAQDFAHKDEYDDVDGVDGAHAETALERVRASPSELCVANPSARKKGHLLPIYEAVPANTFCLHQHLMECLQSWPGVATGMPRFPQYHPLSQNQLLPVAVPPDIASLSVTDGVLSIALRHSAPRGRHPLHVTAPPRSLARHVSFKSSLVAMDLSRARHLTSVGGAGLGALRRVRLPPDVRVACFDGCGQLAALRPTEGATRLLSLRCDGCRRLELSANDAHAPAAGASLSEAEAAEAAALWRWESLVELDLSWCTSVTARTLRALLPSAPCLASVALRGLCLHGVLEALLATPAFHLKALDLGFSTNLDSAAVREFVQSHPAVGRCNLRAARGVSADVYNEVGWLMQARSSQPDVVENRRRPRHLAPRAAEPFYYLKRQREEPTPEGR